MTIDPKIMTIDQKIFNLRKPQKESSMAIKPEGGGAK